MNLTIFLYKIIGGSLKNKTLFEFVSSGKHFHFMLNLTCAKILYILIKNWDRRLMNSFIKVICFHIWEVNVCFSWYIHSFIIVSRCRKGCWIFSLNWGGHYWASRLWLGLPRVWDSQTCLCYTLREHLCNDRHQANLQLENGTVFEPGRKRKQARHIISFIESAFSRSSPLSCIYIWSLSLLHTRETLS